VTPETLAEAIEKLMARNAELLADRDTYRAAWEAAEAEVALTRDTLTHRTQALQRGIDRPCPHCSATEETP
jgi:outer membrane murein-binding lipoprotein Lpp